MRRVRSVWSLVILVLITGLSGCLSREASENSQVVSVSILPFEYFIDQLTDNTLEVNVMVPQGASHGTYSPSPRQMQKLSDSDIYFRISALGYEQAFIHRLRELNNRMRVVDLSDDLELIHGICDHGDHVHEAGIDPHIWMSPKVMLSILPRLKEVITETYPDLQVVVEKNYSILEERISVIHNEMEALSRGLNNKSFLIFHPALTYLARDYGLVQISIEHEGKEPTPGQLMRIVRQSRAEEIPVIFIQEEYDKRNALLVSQETGAEIVQINPLKYNWEDSMRHIMETLSLYMQ